MTKRLKYTKDILTHMLNNNNNNPQMSSKGGPGSSTAISNLGASSNNNVGGPSSRMGTITSAVSSKRSVIPSEAGMPGSIGGGR
jgi:hypothetical protein